MFAFPNRDCMSIPRPPPYISPILVARSALHPLLLNLQIQLNYASSNSDGSNTMYLHVSRDCISIPRSLS